MSVNQIVNPNRTELLQVVTDPTTHKIGVVSIIDIPELKYVSESGNSGWRLKESDFDNHGDIGNWGIDFGRSTSPSSVFGATGQDSFCFGVDNESSGNKSGVFGASNVSGGYASMSWGSFNQSNADLSSTWGELNIADGENSSVSGIGNTSKSFASVIIGTYANVGVGQTSGSIVSTDEVFKVGIGSSDLSRGDGFLIFKDGTITAPSLTEAKINAAGDSAITTREFVNNAVSGLATNLGYTPSPTDGTVTSDTGTNATLPSATGINSGLLLPADFDKLSNITVTQAVDLDTMEGDISTNNAKVSNATHTGDVTGSTALTIATGAVDIPMLSATGTADGTTFLRGDNTWSVPLGSGDVSKVGTPRR